MSGGDPRKFLRKNHRRPGGMAGENLAPYTTPNAIAARYATARGPTPSTREALRRPSSHRVTSNGAARAREA